MENAKADKFTFENRSFSREPHIKIDDYTNPNEVGRVYFAIDAKSRRFVVDHAGTKLY